MNIKESLRIVSILHSAYPQDKRATADELAQRAESYNIALGDYDFETVKKAAEYCIRSSKWHPTTRELLDAVARARITDAPTVTPIPSKGEAPDPDEVEKYLEAFVEWIGFGCEPNDAVELPRGVLPYEK